jgi:hypothetical protein
MANTPLEFANPLHPANYLPFSGPVNQAIATSWFSPTLTVNYQGSAPIEQRVVTEVASYGRQIGWLTEIVAALLKEHPVPKPSKELKKTLERFDKALKRIAQIKESVQRDAYEEARDALERLRQQSPKEFARLVRQEAQRAPEGE